MKRRPFVVIGLAVALLIWLLSLNTSILHNEEGGLEEGITKPEIVRADPHVISEFRQKSFELLDGPLADHIKQAGTRERAWVWDSIGNPGMAALEYEAAANQVQNASGTESPEHVSLLKLSADKFLLAWELSGDSVLRHNWITKARQNYRLALDADSADSDAKTGLGVSMAASSSAPMQGIQMLLEVVQEHPEHETANYHLGRFSLQTAQFAKAIQRFEAVRKSRDDAEIRYYLGQAYAGSGDTERAIVEFEKSAEMVQNPEFKAEIFQQINRLKN